MAVILGPLLNRANIDDASNPALELTGALGVHTLTVGGRTFAYVAGFSDDGISGFEAAADGSLFNIPGANITDNASLELNGAANFASATVGGVTYLYVNGAVDNGLSVFQVAANGALTNVQNVVDDATLELLGAIGKMSVASVGGVSYLIASGISDDGVSAFRIGADGRLTNTAHLDDSANVALALNGARGTATATIGGNSFVFVGGADDSGITSLRLAAGGTFAFADSIFDSENPALELNNVTDLATAAVGGTTYLFASGFSDSGISVFSVNAAGLLTNVFNLADTPDLGLSLVQGLSIVTIGGETFLSASSGGDNALGLYHVAANGALTHVTTTVDDATLELSSARFSAFATVGGVPILIGSGVADNGLSSFEVGGGDDFLQGTADADILFGLAGLDTLIGNDGNDTLFGGVGGDMLRGGNNDDFLYGQGGVDNLFGGTGNDSYYILNAEDQADTITETVNFGFDTVYAFANFSISGFANVERMIAQGSAVTSMTGNSEVNYFYTDRVSQTVTVSGGLSVDYFFSDGNGDTLIGGEGNDRFYVSESSNVTYSELAGAAQGFDTIYASVGGTMLAANVERMILSGTAQTGFGTNQAAGLVEYLYANPTLATTLRALGGNDYLFGGGAGDVLDGGLGLDRLYGGAGIDRLDAGGGVGDQLRGEGGLDFFVFDDAVGGRYAYINDWAEGETLDLRGSGVTAGQVAINQSGADTLVTYSIGSGTNTINLVGIAAATITTSDDFLFG